MLSLRQIVVLGLASYLGTSGLFVQGQQQDGLYWVSGQATDSAITTLDGQKIFLGKPFAEKIDEAVMESQNNDNTIFSFTLTQNKPYSFDRAARGIALVLQKKGLIFPGCGGNATERDYNRWLSDPDFISKVVAFFKIVPQDRKHPGHQFTTKFVVNPDGYALSGPIAVTLQITNCGNQPFSIEQPSIPRGLLYGFSFSAYGVDQAQWSNAVLNKPFLPPRPDMVSHKVVLNPRDTQSIPVNLSDYLVIKKTGTCLVRGTYAFQVMDSGKSWRVLWDDFATAEFEVETK